MSIFDRWFQTGSRQREQIALLGKLVFPLGEGQRECIRITLHELVGARVKDEEKLFWYLCAKEAYLQKTDDGEEAAGRRAYAKLAQMHVKDPRDRQVIVALLHLERDLPSLEDFPSPQAVLARSYSEEAAGN